MAEHGSSHGQILALTVSFAPNPLDSGERDEARIDAEGLTVCHLAPARCFGLGFSRKMAQNGSSQGQHPARCFGLGFSENGSSQGLILALTVSCVPSPLDSGERDEARVDAERLTGCLLAHARCFVLEKMLKMAQAKAKLA